MSERDDLLSLSRFTLIFTIFLSIYSELSLSLSLSDLVAVWVTA